MTLKLDWSNWARKSRAACRRKPIWYDVRGEILKAFVVRRPGEELTKAEVIAWCRQKLAGYKVPRLVEFRDELPKTIVGKVLRRALREEEEQKMANRKRRRSTDVDPTFIKYCVTLRIY